MSPKAWNCNFHTTTVCIDSYENGNPVGRFYHSGSGESHDFQSLTQFLTRMERAMDDMEYPKAFTEPRSFVPAEVLLPEPATGQVARGRVATFAVQVLFRQNTSWQGAVTWLEGRQEKSFRSVLELVLMMDNAIICARSA